MYCFIIGNINKFCAEIAISIATNTKVISFNFKPPENKNALIRLEILRPFS